MHIYKATEGGRHENVECLLRGQDETCVRTNPNTTKEDERLESSTNKVFIHTRYSR